MKRQFMSSLLLAIILFCGVGCAARYSIKKEAPNNMVPKAYSRIHVGWLDLDETNWKKFGYASKDIWNQVIKENYDNGLKPYLQELLPNKKLSFHKSKTDALPTGGDLYITFSDTVVQNKWKAGVGGFDYINTTIHFTNLKTNEELYKASISASSMGVGMQGWTFEGRLGFATYNIALMISEKLK
jgi:hypothetical protein